MGRTLGIFAKFPEAGRVKTRLAAVLGEASAARLAAAFVADTLASVRSLPCERWVAYAPDDARSRAWFAAQAGTDVRLWPQPAGDLGARLSAFCGERLTGPASRVVVIGSDSPNLPVAFVQEAFERLERCDVVMGPACDGGYYLLGLRGGTVSEGDGDRWSWPAVVFTGIEWSGSRVLEQTRAAVRAAGRSLELLAPWYDVDTPDDLRRLRDDLHAREAAGDGTHCPATRACLAELSF